MAYTPTPTPLNWVTISAPSGTGFHLYLTDANDRKIGVCWGKAAEKVANANLFSSAPELLEQVELFIRCLEYEIRVSEKKGDDEGARLKSLTLAIAKSVVARALGEADAKQTEAA